ncbi:Tubulin-folding cofactor E [Porphyridium purpureum]|uniref:Tubulin-folding cofactor E n=1 Tax=Porphyridium purpureum TaxID=35688 RepID=A0A5J4Z7F9_PORPP|nr:Tubulin-folding cofactor E [Porphyridium purpureum]|eukprot:POR6872..scf295_1
MMSASEEIPSTPLHVGQRVHARRAPEQRGTIRYLGPIESTRGEWVGVEWDRDVAPRRGVLQMHDGSVKGVRYFQASRAASSTCVRKSMVSTGVALAHALRSKYQESQVSGPNPSAQSNDMGPDIVLQSVEYELRRTAPSKLECVQSIVLSKSGIRDTVDEQNSLEHVDLDSLRSLKELDVSKNLLTDLGRILELPFQLPSLEKLNLSSNEFDLSRFSSWLAERQRQHLRHDGKKVACGLRSLILNQTGIDWRLACDICTLFPTLEEVHLHGNGICLFQNSDLSEKGILKTPRLPPLQLVDLSENSISDWPACLQALAPFASTLEELYLSKNDLEKLAESSNADESTIEKRFMTLKNIDLVSNPITSPADAFNRLRRFPALTELAAREWPGVSDAALRCECIARLDAVRTVNHSIVLNDERIYAEKQLVRQIQQALIQNDDVALLCAADLPRAIQLAERYGIPLETAVSARTPGDKLTGLAPLGALERAMLHCSVDALPGHGALLRTSESSLVSLRVPRSTLVLKMKQLLLQVALNMPLDRAVSLRMKALWSHEGVSEATLDLDDEMMPLGEIIPTSCPHTRILVWQEDEDLSLDPHISWKKKER